MGGPHIIPPFTQSAHSYDNTDSYEKKPKANSTIHITADMSATMTKETEKPAKTLADQITNGRAKANNNNARDTPNSRGLSRLFKKQNKLAVPAALVAALTVTEVGSRTWYHEESATFSQSKEELFNYVTYLQDIKEVWHYLITCMNFAS